ncbi:hypothetical protein CAL29_22885 [Bordetella genomosp. 10]|uniref:Uncharacterized protein n=1 Tax=Bordetella genomosp. 10 TaxID=1416804 RepID=A0A261S0E8_9BORD|nr:hypothetical protein [Bordetella genomosp. 10]OZI30826.1 hypothetical protein CAL29_22885 [Bordetella genomosp. 10]
MSEPILYQHTDGRFGLSLTGGQAEFTRNDPAWRRVPIDLIDPKPGDGQVAHALTLNGHQLWDALEFLAPDRTDEQLEQAVCIHPGPARTADGFTEAAGLYCWLADYPEEGSIRLDDTAPIISSM